MVIFGFGSVAKPLLTGLPSIWVAFLLIELLATKRKLLWYMIVNAIITSIYFAAIMYYKYYGVIVNYSALRQANQVVEVKASVFDLMHPYFLLIFLDIVIMTIVFLFNKRSREWGKPRKTLPRWIAGTGFALSLLVCSTTVWANKDIVNEIKMAEQMGILNYEVYTIVTGSEKQLLDPASVTHEAVMAVKQQQPPEEPLHRLDAEGKNIIMIQLESQQNFLMDLMIDGREVTPNLNKLKRESYYFSNFYQQIGQGNTSDAEYLANTSLYVPSNGAASQIYGRKELPGLPRLLKELGYTSLTFHTNAVTFWDRDQLYPALGFDRYYDKAFFGEGDIVQLGASDEVLYAKTAEELEKLHKQGQKFYAHIISMSNHHPFTLPESKHPMPLPDEFEDTLLGNYLQSVHYADEALGSFIERLKRNGLWEDSVIVIYGDHFGLPLYSLTRAEKQLMEDILGREYNYTDMLNVPLLIHIPGVTAGQTFANLGGQVDIMPTIANLVGLSLEDRIYFGQDLLNSDANLLPMRYYLPSGSFINEETIFVPGEQITDGVFYPLRGKETVPSAEQLQQDFENALQLLEMSDSYVWHLPNRAVSNTRFGLLP
jgi:phosphoglycerol transferase MdoB-like AlkP superfamily enzyme